MIYPLLERKEIVSIIVIEKYSYDIRSNSEGCGKCGFNLHLCNTEKEKKIVILILYSTFNQLSIDIKMYFHRIGSSK